MAKKRKSAPKKANKTVTEFYDNDTSWSDKDDAAWLNAHAGKGTVTSKSEAGFSGYAAKTCSHTGRKDVMTLALPKGDITVGAAARHDLPNFQPEGTVLLNCTGLEPSADLILPRGFEALQKHVDSCPVITVNWPDGGCPPLSFEFWLELPKLMHAKGYSRLVPYCLGSHGRTGTALASLAIAHLGLTAKDAVDLIRKAHCRNAVETFSQIDYLIDMELVAREYGLTANPHVTDATDIIPSYAFRLPAANAAASTSAITPLTLRDRVEVTTGISTPPATNSSEVSVNDVGLPSTDHNMWCRCQACLMNNIIDQHNSTSTLRTTE